MLLADTTRRTTDDSEEGKIEEGTASQGRFNHHHLPLTDIGEHRGGCLVGFDDTCHRSALRETIGT